VQIDQVDSRLIGVQSIAMGEGHTCVMNDPDIFCWGRDYEGQASETPGELVRTPPATPLALGYDLISAGTYHSCGRRNNEPSTLRCWGRPSAQQRLEQDGAASSSVVTASVWAFIGASNITSCGLGDTGVLRCWGQLAGMSSGATVTNLYLGRHFGVFKHGTGPFMLEEWGTECSVGAIDENLDTPRLVRMTGSIVGTVAVGDSHACALEGSSIVCWGSNDYGQVGTTEQGCLQPNIVPHPQGRPWADVTAAGSHTCAVDTFGALYCWGENQGFSLGDSFPSASVPTRIGNKTWELVRTGVYHTCGRDTTDRLFCWGLNRYGEVGTGKSFTGTPAPIR
jgi:alpha-tubulin suppressor-like RCC1 family protein